MTDSKHEFGSVFHGVKASFLGAIFKAQENADVWIRKNNLTDTLTKHPVGVSVGDGALGNETFAPKKEFNNEFIGRFIYASQEHHPCGDDRDK